MKITALSQRDLDATPVGERDSILGPLKHCAAGDSEITLRIFMKVLLLSIRGLNAQNANKREIRPDFCFLGLDL
jgi:hypothetical protein